MEKEEKITIINDRINSLKRRILSYENQIELIKRLPEEEHLGIEICNGFIVDHNRQITALESLRNNL